VTWFDDLTKITSGHSLST